MGGPLRGLTIVELAGIGPGPFAGMLLADMGADVIRVDRIGGGGIVLPPDRDVLNRSRRHLSVDLKSEGGREVVLRLVTSADALIEGYRPGVAERLGLGPDACMTRNPGLVYGRMTGWGQHGPLADRAGHDLTYMAIAGGLEPIGLADAPPPPPLNFVADFGGGGMMLAMGVCAALVERATSGRGQVVDAAMVDGVAIQTALFHGLRAVGAWRDERQANLLDGGAHFYRCYVCADGRYVAVGALEPQFYAALCAGLGLDVTEHPQGDPTTWPAAAEVFAGIFATRTRDEWAERFAGTDACVAPVLGLGEAPDAPHNVARSVFTEVGGVVQPAPAPRFERTPSGPVRAPRESGADTDALLAEVGYDAQAIAALRESGAVA